MLYVGERRVAVDMPAVVTDATGQRYGELALAGSYLVVRDLKGGKQVLVPLVDIIQGTGLSLAERSAAAGLVDTPTTLWNLAVRIATSGPPGRMLRVRLGEAVPPNLRGAAPVLRETQACCVAAIRQHAALHGALGLALPPVCPACSRPLVPEQVQALDAALAALIRSQVAGERGDPPDTPG